ncbi:MAG: hypothetical protein IJN09_02695 [Oscillospiraceae bacterium]|nr:hypothetical protein [Oscillospiraceae bacterium]
MKKFLSIILALTMVIALIPATFAADEITENNYVFNISSIKDRTENYNDNRGAWSFTQVDSSKSEPFRVAGCRNISSNGSMTSEHMNIPFKNVDYSIFDIHIVVTIDGAVQPTIRHKLNNIGIDVDFYLYRLNDPNDINLTDTSYDTVDITKSRLEACLSGEANTQFLGTINTYAETWTGTIIPEELNKVNVTPGEYILVCYGKFAEGTVDKTEGKAVFDSFNLKKLEEDTKLITAFKPDDSVTAEDYTEPTVISITKDGSEIKSVKNSDGTHNITAPEINKAGAKFLYWAKGLSAQKRILLGETNELKNYAPDSKYANYLIPVYADEVSGADEYYNANGQLIPGANKETTVSMAGYGASTGWDQYGDTSIYVAHYDLDKPEKNIDVTVTNGTGTGTYAFGDTVTCTANGTGTFKCWTKSNIHGATDTAPEIASVDKTYTFNAWENCTVKAVYEPHNYTGNKMKIIIDTFDVAVGVTGVMAEFIGLDSAVEKGIMFTDSSKNTTKIAMTTKDNQFTVIADETGTYKGYAIVKEEDNSYTLITDGEYTK